MTFLLISSFSSYYMFPVFAAGPAPGVEVFPVPWVILKFFVVFSSLIVRRCVCKSITLCVYQPQCLLCSLSGIVILRLYVGGFLSSVPCGSILFGSSCSDVFRFVISLLNFICICITLLWSVTAVDLFEWGCHCPLLWCKIVPKLCVKSKYIWLLSFRSFILY